jgi:hypothetical protein
MKRLCYSTASLALIGLFNAVVVYIGLLPCGLTTSDSGMCRALVLQMGSNGTRLLTPHSWFYYPAHVLLLLPTVLFVGLLVARDATPVEWGRTRAPVQEGALLGAGMLVAFVVALTFTRLAFR